MRLLAVFAFVLLLAASVYAKSSSGTHHRIPVHRPHRPHRPPVNHNETSTTDLSVGAPNDRYPILRGALTNLYRLTKGSYWTNANNWQASSDPCTNWFGITCDASGVHINLSNNNVQGDLTSILNSLQPAAYPIVSVDLSSNSITGNVGISLNFFYNLISLNLNGNQLSGSFPDNIFYSNSLSVVGLGGNKFSGNLHQVACSNNLQHFDVSSNLFVGPIPSCFGQSGRLNYFNASYNQLNGTIPFFQNYNNQLVLDLSYNKLSEIDPGNAGPTFHVCNFYGNGFACPVPNWAVQQCVARCY